MGFPVFPHNSQAPVYHRRRGGATNLTYVASSKKLVNSRAAADDARYERQASREKQLASLIAGGIAGTFSATVTCPIEVVKTRMYRLSVCESAAVGAALV